VSREERIQGHQSNKSNDFPVCTGRADLALDAIKNIELISSRFLLKRCARIWLFIPFPV
jgi:hypothetical protein